ncbi:MAG TPA: hypothetical protein VF097_11490 [Actinomycetota bacterium]
MVTMRRTGRRRARDAITRERAGRALFGVVSAALLLSGTYLVVNTVPDADDLRRSGISWEELLANRPAVAVYLERLLRLTGVAAAGLGTMALAGALSMRSAGRPVWRMLWTLPAITAAITSVLVAEGNPIAWYYGGLTLLAAAGLVLARPGKEEG